MLAALFDNIANSEGLDRMHGMDNSINLFSKGHNFQEISKVKGILYKESNGAWHVMNFQATAAGPSLQTLPILQEEFDVNSKMKPIIELVEGKEVEFDVWIGKYAKLIK